MERLDVQVPRRADRSAVDHDDEGNLILGGERQVEPPVEPEGRHVREAVNVPLLLRCLPEALAVAFGDRLEPHDAALQRHGRTKIAHPRISIACRCGCSTRLSSSIRRLALLVFVAALVSVSAAAAASVPGYYGCTSFFLDQHHQTAVVRPHSIVVACGDGNFALLRLRWTSWNGLHANAQATASQNDCKPYCAAGHFHSYPATVVLSRPRTCKNGVRVFTQLAWRFTAARPAGEPRTGSIRYPC